MKYKFKTNYQRLYPKRNFENMEGE